MPTPLIKAFAKKAHRSKKRVERYWDEAKDAAAKKFSKKDPAYWAYVNAITQRRAGLREGELSFREFLEIDEDLGKPKIIKGEKGLTHKEALAKYPWKPAYGDCRAFGYDPETGEVVWH